MPSTLGIVKEIPKPEELWNTENLRDRYAVRRAPHGRQPSETKGEG